MKVNAPQLAPLFRSSTQCSLLAVLLDDPSRQWTQSEIAATVPASQATVSREMNRLVASGLTTEEAQGNRRVYRANTAHPLFQQFADILATTFGMPAILRGLFAPIERTDAVIVFGSWAARRAGLDGVFPGDIDLLLLGQPDRQSVYDAADAAQARIALPVQPTIRRTSLWSEPDAFLLQVQSRPYLVLAANSTAEAAGVPVPDGTP